MVCGTKDAGEVKSPPSLSLPHKGGGNDGGKLGILPSPLRGGVRGGGQKKQIGCCRIAHALAFQPPPGRHFVPSTLPARGRFYPETASAKDDARAIIITLRRRIPEFGVRRRTCLSGRNNRQGSKLGSCLGKPYGGTRKEWLIAVTEPENKEPEKRWRFFFLAIDAWIDTGIYRFGEAVRNRYDAYSVFMRRFRVTGAPRSVVEVLSDGLSFGTVGALLALALALPAFDATKTDWRTQVEYSVTFLDRFGEEIGRRGIFQNDSIPLEDVPDFAVKAVLATEDRRFFDHFGIDVIGTFRALVENVRAKTVVQGGSSITQQLAKNLFLSNERTLERKVKEAFLAIWLEMNLSKNEILKLYLDRSYMGGGAFGIEAASQYYFGKSVRQVTLAEAALLAGLFKAPTKFAPHINLPAARARANEVLSNMVEAGFASEGQVVAARRNPAIPIDRLDDENPNYFLDWAFIEAKRLAKGDDRVLFAHTTVDLNLQRAAENALESTLREYGRERRTSQGAIVLVTPEGAVRAMVGGRDYGQSVFNRAVDALRQPGSSFKPFVYTTAMMNGYSPRSVVVDAPINIGGWSPRNYGRSYRGAVTLMTALVKSINTIPVRLAQAIGRDKIIDTAKRMGIRSELKITRPLPLGVAEVSVIDMASAYAVFANGGMRAMPHGVLQIRNTKGELLYDHSRDEPAAERVLPEKTVAQMNSILTRVISSGTGRRAIIEGVIAGGKTGTTQAYRDAWFIGFTGNFSAAVWLGNDNFKPTGRVTGGFLPAMTWNKLMRFAHANVDLKPIPGIGASGELLVTRKSKNRVSVSLAPKSGPPVVVGGAIPLSLSEKSTAAIDRIGALLREAAGAETAGGTLDDDRAGIDDAETRYAGRTKAPASERGAGER